MLQDKEVQFFIIIAIAVFILLIFFIIIFITNYYKKQITFFKEKQELTSRFKQELLQTQLEIREQTLKNISQEIHDNIGQVLSLAKLNLSTMDIKNPVALEEKILDSRKQVSKAIQDLRDLSRSLNTDYISEMGLLRSIEYELEMIRKTGTIKTQLDVTGQLYKLDPQKELILFRIIQETLNNIIKHAKAGIISIHVTYDPENIVMTVEDNGQGFDPGSADKGKSSVNSLGIRNMHNRAKLIGADFAIHSGIGKGTRVIIQSPKEENHAAPRN